MRKLAVAKVGELKSWQADAVGVIYLAFSATFSIE